MFGGRVVALQHIGHHLYSVGSSISGGSQDSGHRPDSVGSHFENEAQPRVRSLPERALRALWAASCSRWTSSASSPGFWLGAFSAGLHSGYVDWRTPVFF